MATVVERQDTSGYAILEGLGALGWSAVITADGEGGVIVLVERDGVEISERGASVAEVAPRIAKAAGWLAWTG